MASLSPLSVAAKVFLTVDEALDLAFPGCEVTRRTVYLTEPQRRRVAALAGTPLTGAVVHPYEARCDGEPAGVAYFDVHRVRTLPETLMVVVDPHGAVARVEVLAFDEPQEYVPRDAWYQQFPGRSLDAELQLKRGIHPVTGATLTARATTDATRRVLALHRVLQDGGRAGRPREGRGDAPGPGGGSR
ncbi:MAG TPA: FMN-binding protein [Thermoanaerobaculia bacterium]|nr:FMN-binding protein [Thermoanaerobaculia bacterium]